MWVPVAEFEASAVDEVASVSDALIKVVATMSSDWSCLESGSVSTPTLYDSGMAWVARDCAVATHSGCTAE